MLEPDKIYAVNVADYLLGGRSILYRRAIECGLCRDINREEPMRGYQRSYLLIYISTSIVVL